MNYKAILSINLATADAGMWTCLMKDGQGAKVQATTRVHVNRPRMTARFVYIFENMTAVCLHFFRFMKPETSWTLPKMPFRSDITEWEKRQMEMENQ